MDQKELNERAERLQEIGRIIEKLPIEIRSEAFDLLRGYVSTQARAAAAHEKPVERDADVEDDGNLFTRFDHEKASDNVRLIAAHLFQEYGSEPFSAEEVRAEAARAGITIPDRVDMTLAQAKENGKQLFVRSGRGKFKPTVHGETYLKATYEVRKGTRTRAECED